MSTAVATRTNLRNELARYTPRLVAAAVAPGGEAGRVTYAQRQITLAAMIAQKQAAEARPGQPLLADCDPASIATALIRHCATGLELGTEAHLVPFGRTCTYIPDWKGLIVLMIRSGHVRDVQAQAVYAKDHFRLVQGMTPRLEHEPHIGTDRGAVVGYYAIAWLRHGYPTFEYMSDAEVEKIRAKAQSGNSPAWRDNRAEMGKKTVVRRLAKRMPQTPALGAAIAAEEAPDVAGVVAPADGPAPALPSVADALGVERPRAIMAPADPYADEQAPVTAFDRNDPFPSADAVADEVGLQLDDKRAVRRRPNAQVEGQ